MERSRAKALALAAVFLAAIAGVGYLSLSSSSYKSVSDLLAADHKVKATVQGQVVPLGKGVYMLNIDGETLRVEAHGSYGVAHAPDGGVYAVFVISDGDNAVLAVYKLGEREYAAYLAGTGLKSNVVVSGVYDPDSTAVLVTPQGALHLKVLYVDAILKGCHESYQQGAATTG